MSQPNNNQAASLPGADLQAVIRDHGGDIVGPDGRPRQAVLFATDDMITEPLPLDDDLHNPLSWQQYAVYTGVVERLRSKPAKPGGHPHLPDLRPGPVVQPRHIRALRSGPWKLVRYCDPWSPKPVADQWELYNLDVDPTEVCNRVHYSGEFPRSLSENGQPTADKSGPRYGRHSRTGS